MNFLQPMSVMPMSKTKASALAVAAVLVAGPALAAEAPADLVIINGRMPTVASPNATALAVRNGRIVTVGTDAKVSALRGPRTRVIDARRRTVLPGFNDNHVHLSWGAPTLFMPDVRNEKNVAGIVARVRAHAAANPNLTWVEAGGFGLEQIEGGRPTRQMLDAAVADRPVVLWSLDRHMAWANSKALELAGVTRETRDPPHGTIERDPATGEPTGWFKEFSALDLLINAMPKPSVAEQRERMTAAMREAHKFGVTAVAEATGSIEEYKVLDDMQKSGDLNLRVTYALPVRPGFTDADFQRYQTFWKANPPSDSLKAGAVKMFLDGVPQAHTAFLLHPYGPQPMEGQPAYEPTDLKKEVRRFDAAGWQVMIHAMGDAAVRLALDSYEEAAKANPAPARGRRHRIEHVFIMDPVDVPRFAKLNVIAAYQPIDVFLPPSTQPVPPAPNKPPQDSARWNAIQAAKGHAAFGSDWPVFTMNALARIYAIANSRRADQRMPVVKAIDAYTRESAYATFDDADQGALEPGKFGDIAILSRDILANPPTKPEDLAVDMTIFNGKVVYER
jgi:predicted amidohydrolase YtcJ